MRTVADVDTERSGKNALPGPNTIMKGKYTFPTIKARKNYQKSDLIRSYPDSGILAPIT